MRIVYIFAVTLISSSSVVHAQDAVFDIDATTVTRESSGSCKVGFVLKNTYESTLKVSGEAVIINMDGAALGDGYVAFPPALSGGTSLSDANFYSWKIAGGSCPVEFDVNITTSYCEIVGSSYKLVDRACIKTFKFNVRRPTPN